MVKGHILALVLTQKRKPKILTDIWNNALTRQELEKYVFHSNEIPLDIC